MAARKLFDPASDKPFALSRSKVELYQDCPRCFYLDRRLGIARPAGFPFNLNSAVDALLKTEFDQYRAQGAPHPLMVDAGINAVPHAHPQLGDWRNNFRGVRTVHEQSNFELFGAIDDLWRDLATNELIVVDYKATSKTAEVSIDADRQMAYKRQMEFYQWLLRRNGLTVSIQGWFVYCNGKKDRSMFNQRLEFEVSMLPYVGDDSWVEPVLVEIKRALDGGVIPPSVGACEYCDYVAKALAS